MLYIILYWYNALWNNFYIYIFNPWFTWIVDKQVSVTATFISIVLKFLTVLLLVLNERAKSNYKIMENINLRKLN